MSLADSYDRSRGLFTTADTIAITQDGESFDDTIWDYLTKGVGSAGVSAAIGFYNTGVALGDTLSLWDGEDYMGDERDAVAATFGESTAQFYDRHKTGIDVLGLVAGSLVPGMGAIRAMRALQVAGKVPGAAQAATGLRNADLVMGSRNLELAKEAALKAHGQTMTPAIRAAMGTGVKQQVAEAFVFEAGMLLTMNQNAAMNPDDFGYLQAVRSQAVEGLPFVFLGGAIGSGVDAIRIYGSVKKHVASEYRRTNKYSLVGLPALEGLPPGDRLAVIADVAGAHKQLAAEIGESDWLARRQYDIGTGQIRDAVMKSITDMNHAGKQGVELMENLVKQASNGQLDNVARVLAGATRLDRLGPAELEKFTNFFERTRSPTVVKGDIDQVSSEMENMLGRMLMQASTEVDPKVAAKLQELAFTQVVPVGNEAMAAQGFARTAKRTAEAGSQIEQTVFRNTGLKVHFFTDDAGNLKYVSPVDVAVVNTETIAGNLAEMNRTNRRFGLKEVTQEEVEDITLFHELAHLKSNPTKLLHWVDKAFGNAAKTNIRQSVQNPKTLASRANNVQDFKDLVKLSVMNRTQHWYGAMQQLVNKGGIPGQYEYAAREIMVDLKRGVADTDFKRISEMSDKITELMVTMQKEGQLHKLDSTYTGYMMGAAELLADAGAQLTNPASRELAAKVAPHLAKRMERHGLLAPAWNDTKTFYHVRTGEVMTGWLPGIADLTKGAKVSFKQTEPRMYVPELSKEFVLAPKLFDGPELLKAGAKKVDILEYDAQWYMIAQTPIASFLNKDGEMILSENMLPLMEKLAMLAAKNDPEVTKLFKDQKIFTIGAKGRTGLVKETLEAEVISRKRNLHAGLQLSSKYNEQEIAKILNITPKTAMGQEDEWMLYGVKDFSQPEVLQLSYKPHTMKQYEASTKSLAAVQERQEVINALQQNAAAELLGTQRTQMPTMTLDEVMSVTPADSRAGLLNNLRPEFGTLREKAAAVGKWVQQRIVKVGQELDSDFAKFSNVFNHKDAQGLRYELANISNLLQREWYYLAGNAEEGYHVVRKDALQDALAEMAEEGGGAIPAIDSQLLNSLPSDMLKGLRTLDAAAPASVKVSDEVAEFFSMHQRRNSKIVGKKRTVAGAYGRDAVLDENILYPPPRDLRKSRYFAFVTPKTFTEGSDSRKYMIYGETRAEFDAKMALVQQKHGNRYNVVLREDVENFKRLQGEYDEGLVFDDIMFDASMKRRGDASELLPNADLNVSGTLDRYKSWHHRQEEFLIRQGVEFQYADVLQSLRGIDSQVARPETSALTGRGRERDTIWKDTVAVMMDTKSYGGPMEDLWVRFNDYVGNKGSQLIDGMLGALTPGSRGFISQVDLDSFNAKLAENGFESPFSSVMEVMVASPDPQVSRALPSLVRTMNNLAGTMMLRMDTAHAIVQLISTPILAMPVLMEAKQALRGTPAGQQLANLTSVVNPANGMREPTVAKLLMKATKEFWSPQGKEFMQELRDRGIVSDYLRQYLEAMDFSQINGRHTLKQVNDVIDKMAQFGSKWSGFTFAEEFTRFQVAWSAREIGRLRGIADDELWSVVGSSVDKVHGIYMAHQRPQLFQGVVGQAMGLYQTYVFNFAQNALKFASNGQRAQLATMGAMQGAIFGVQSFPGFKEFNQMIGETNRDNLDLYSVTNANDPKSNAAYLMYGLGSHMFGTPIDFYTRGDLATRHALVVPLNPLEFPAVQLIAKAVGNMVNVAGQLAPGSGIPTSEALLHGLAHNGMNRPLQGIGQIMRNRITSNYGQVYFEDSNYLDYDSSQELNYGAMFARLLGTRPQRESIIMNEYFRDMAYRANTRREISEVGTALQFNIAAGTADAEAFKTFARKYERAGGDIQNFNAFMGRQFQSAQRPIMDTFYNEMMRDSELARTYRRMEMERSLSAPWTLDEPLE